MGAGAHLQNFALKEPDKTERDNTFAHTFKIRFRVSCLNKKCFELIGFGRNCIKQYRIERFKPAELIGKLSHHGLPSYNHNRNNYNRNTI